MNNKVKQPKKDQKKKVSQDERKKKQVSGFSYGKILFVSALLAGLASYYFYKVLTTPPEPPKLDFNEYWGTYPMKMDPDLSIRPYEVEFSEVMINDLRERLLHRHPFVPPLDDTGFTYGFNSNFLIKILDYWQNKYNFKDREQFFNKYKHYITNIQGLDVHYLHIKPQVSKDIEVVPLLLLHGWPGSIREFYEMIPMLITPRPKYNFVFEIIAPSLPGFGFSQAPSRPGFGPTEMAIVISNLMKRIGHNKYYIQGGDFGHLLGSILATLMPEQVLGFHTNNPGVMSPLANVYIMLGSLWPSLIVEPELQDRMYPWSEHAMRLIEEFGYLHIQATKPDTVGIALSDSPAGLAAYILEKFSTWTNSKYKMASDGNLLSKFTLTHLLDNVMVYWSTNTITTSMRLYAESVNKRFLAMNIDSIPTGVPTWGIKFKHELFFHPDCVLKLKYTNYLHSTIVEDGGHFAAFENPDIMANDIFEAIDEFKQFHNVGSKQQETINQGNHETAQTIYDFTVKDINGREIRLDKYKGYALLIVNVASQCGLTDNNYNQLNELYEKYAKSRDFRILAFPCNQFGGQEPGSPKDIIKFTKERNVKFDVFEKIEVNGENTHPLFKFLKRTQSGTLGDFIKWNFSKFIVDKNGIPVERFGPNVNPIDLEPHLAKYW